MSKSNGEDQKQKKFDYDDSVYVLFGEIDDDSTKIVVEWILDHNYRKEHKNLYLVICSGGGDVHSGFALIDIIAGSKIPIHTVGLGMIASMGLMIFLTGKTRILTPNTTIMSHQFSGYNIGKEHELVAHVKLNSITSEMIVRHLKKYTGLSEKKVKSKLLPPSDVWLSAEEAKELGICDVIEKFGD